ncbi:MAG: complex I NDUFA9 subunit family protein [Comamonadaceae bacterium]|nr:MAG: complex I NDUFA9 subunit family protein [Comamonadaceae bacterium]
MKKILILGGTGFVGRHLCEKLAARQWRTTVATRRLVRARDLWTLPMVDPVEVRQLDSASLVSLLAGHDAVVNLVAILHGDEKSFNAAHVELPLHLAKACDAAGVRRIVHVSALGAAVDAPSMYQRSKARGEAVLNDAGLDVTILRPSVIFGDGDRFLNTFANLQQYFPVIPLASSDARFQPVWVGDVADAIVRCLDEPATIGKTYEACGPDVFTLKELVRLSGHYTGINGGRGRPVLALPAALGRLQAGVMGLAPGEPMLSGDNLDSMKVPNVSGGQLPGLRDLGVQPSSLAAIAPSYLGAQGLRSGLMAKRKTAGRF